MSASNSQREVLTLCLRLCLEPADSHSPETLEVLERYRPAWEAAAGGMPFDEALALLQQSDGPAERDPNDPDPVEHAKELAAALIEARKELIVMRAENRRFRNGFANLNQALADAPGLPMEIQDKEALEKWTDTLTGILMALGVLETTGRPLHLFEALTEAAQEAQQSATDRSERG